MDNPEKLATLGTQDTGRRKTTTTKNEQNIGHHYSQTYPKIKNKTHNKT